MRPILFLIVLSLSSCRADSGEFGSDAGEYLACPDAGPPVSLGQARLHPMLAGCAYDTPSWPCPPFLSFVRLQDTLGCDEIAVYGAGTYELHDRGSYTVDSRIGSWLPEIDDVVCLDGPAGVAFEIFDGTCPQTGPCGPLGW